MQARLYLLWATMYVNGLNGYWLVVGAKNKQQWGYLSRGGSYASNKFTLPIPATAFVIPIPWLFTNSFVTPDISAYDLTSVTVYGYSYDSGNTISGLGYVAISV